MGTILIPFFLCNMWIFYNTLDFSYLCHFVRNQPRISRLQFLYPYIHFSFRHSTLLSWSLSKPHHLCMHSFTRQNFDTLRLLPLWTECLCNAWKIDNLKWFHLILVNKALFHSTSITGSLFTLAPSTWIKILQNAKPAVAEIPLFILCSKADDWNLNAAREPLLQPLSDVLGAQRFSLVVIGLYTASVSKMHSFFQINKCKCSMLVITLLKWFVRLRV